MRVHVAYVGPAAEMLVTLDVEPGTTVADAVARSGIADRIGASAHDVDYAIFGRRVAAARALAEDDRVDITRSLIGDPKVARRRRAAGEG